ncbi:hypothetical protein C404_17250 [Ralstonia sp. AU12-08]|nr:hypothetical protein C404_17250 [Ralstonia sp. AU12-08]
MTEAQISTPQSVVWYLSMEMLKSSEKQKRRAYSREAIQAARQHMDLTYRVPWGMGRSHVLRACMIVLPAGKILAGRQSVQKL